MTPAYDFRDTAPQVEREGDDEKGDFKPTGTSEARYSPPADGPFECGNCVHYKPVNGTHGTCDHPDVIEDAEAGELPKGREDGEPAALVALRGCCSYYRKGEHE